MESFMSFASLAFVDHVILYYFPQQHFAKWLGMTCNYIWGTEIAFEIKKQWYNFVYAQKCFYFICEFYRFLYQGWAKFSSAK